MAKKKNEEVRPIHAEIVSQPITETIEKNYMPYVMSVIVSRAIPEIDGFKPSHRKLLYTMYKMGLMTGARTKSANVVGQTMRLNPHGDAAIYETMVRLTRGNESLLHPFVDSKGSFGKQYSRDMACAASRYTEVKLDPICAELFRGIDKNAVNLVPNYDNTMTEPILFPTSFPNVIVSPNLGIAVGMSSTICSFNLGEVCDGTVALLKNQNLTTDKLMDLIKAPDFSGGASIIYDREQLKKIYETGRGNFKMRARYNYDKNSNCIEIVQIPYSTSIELIQKRLTELVKDGKLKEITDFRDEIDLNGFKLTIDLRKGTDPELFMAKLFKMTPLEDEFNCNFNVLIESTPRLMGVCEILSEWIKFRIDCIKRELTYELNKKHEKLHLLLGLGKILLDIDKAVKIVRDTEKEHDVVPNLMKGFSLDEIQAEYIAEIKLRHLNREYIIDRIKEIESLRDEISELEGTIGDELKIKALISKQLSEIKKKYGKPRKTQLIYPDDITVVNEEDMIENYNVKVVFTKQGYFKKITLLSLRGNDEQKLKDDDVILMSEDAENKDEVVFFTDKCQVYKAKISDFDTQKASALGDFVASKLGFDPGERPLMMKTLTEYNPEHNVVLIFENGKGVRIPISSYETKTNRRRLTGAFSDLSAPVAVLYESAPFDIIIKNSLEKAILINTSIIPVKTTRTSSGVTLFTQKSNVKIVSAEALSETGEKYENAARYRKNKIPATGIALSDYDMGKNQISLM